MIYLILALILFTLAGYFYGSHRGYEQGWSDGWDYRAQNTSPYCRRQCFMTTSQQLTDEAKAKDERRLTLLLDRPE